MKYALVLFFSMIKLPVCLDTSLTLLAFCAWDISNLPPVDATHVDMSAVLTELSALSRKVRAMVNLHKEVKSYTEDVNILNAMLHNECCKHNTDVTDVVLVPTTEPAGQQGVTFADNKANRLVTTLYSRMFC